MEERGDEMLASLWAVTKTRSGGGGIQYGEVHGAHLVPLGLLLPRLRKRTGHG